MRPLLETDRPAAARILDDAVGAGFWGFTDGADGLSFVAVTEGGVAGVVLARLAPADDADVRIAFCGSATARRRCRRPRPARARHRRRARGAPGRASRGGCWPAPRPRRTRAAREPPSCTPGCRPGGRSPSPCASTRRPATTPRPDIAGFYAEGSVAAGARCPYCGDPPCRCAARPFIRLAARLTPPAPRPHRSQVSGDHVRRFAAHSASSRQTKLSFCRSRSASEISSRVFITKGP